MTSNPWPIIPKWKYLLAGAALGGIAGAAAYGLLLSSYTAVAVVQSGRMGGFEQTDVRVTPNLIIDRKSGPQLLVDKLETMDTAEQIAAKAGDATLALQIAGRQYGGNGKLVARQISDGTLIEIRVSSPNRQKALDAVTAAAELTISDDSNSMKDIRDAYAKRIAELKDELSSAKHLSSTLNEKLVGSTGQESLAQAAVSTAEHTSDLSKQINALEVGLLFPMSQDPKLFSKPAIAKPTIGSWKLGVLAGAIAGAAIGFAVGMSRKQTV